LRRNALSREIGQAKRAGADTAALVLRDQAVGDRLQAATRERRIERLRIGAQGAEVVHQASSSTTGFGSTSRAHRMEIS
jgi:hypothetical protein